MTQRPVPTLGSNPIFEIDATAGNETFTLPRKFASGRIITIRRVDGSGNTVTVVAVAPDTLNGVSAGSVTIPRREEVQFVGGDGAWRTVGFGASEAGSAPSTPVPATPVSVSEDYTAAVNDIVLMDATTAPQQVTLPAEPTAGDYVSVLKADATSNAVRVVDPEDRTINGDPDAELVSQWAGGTFMFDGDAWVLSAVTSITTSTVSGGGGSSVVEGADFDGTLTLEDGSTIEFATDQETANAIAAGINTRAAVDFSNVIPATGRTALGLGGAAILNVGTGAGTVMAGNDTRALGGLKSWAASTAYTAGDTVLAPHGQLVRAVTMHTSGATYDPSVWMEIGPDRREARFWPFHEHSIVNLPIATTATWDVTSSGPGARTATLRNPSLNYPWVMQTEYSVPVFFAKTTDPVVTMTDFNYAPRSGSFRMPPDAAPSAGSDKSMAVIEPSGRFAHEMWLATKLTDTTWNCGKHVIVDLYGSGLGPANGIHAAGSSLMGGHIRYQDYLAGEIPHALEFVLGWSSLYYAGGGPRVEDNYGYGEGGNGYVWPATSQDAVANTSYGTDAAAHLPMGQAIGIPPWVDVETLPIQQPGKMIARALQRYGGFIVDMALTTLGCTAEPGIPSSWIGQARFDMLEIQKVLYCMTNSTAATPNGGELLPDGSNRVWRMAPPLHAAGSMPS